MSADETRGPIGSCILVMSNSLFNIYPNDPPQAVCDLSNSRIPLKPGSKAAEIYKSARAIEKYCCNFGLNPGYREQLEDAGLGISGSDQGGETRIMEFPRHPFFLGTLFVPQANSTRENPHPIVRRFLQVAAECAMSGPLSGGGLRSTHQSAV